MRHDLFDSRKNKRGRRENNSNSNNNDNEKKKMMYKADVLYGSSKINENSLVFWLMEAIYGATHYRGVCIEILWISIGINGDKEQTMVEPNTKGYSVWKYVLK